VRWRISERVDTATALTKHNLSESKGCTLLDRGRCQKGIL
jgi:hypothetical protein